jgi:hypothetical protein
MTLKETQAEYQALQENVENAVAILEDAYTPEATRTDLVNAVSQALDLLQEEEEDEEEEADAENGDED